MRIFVTGSSEGLGLHAAQRLVRDGHEVVLHARNAKRADDALRGLGSKAEVVVGDLSALEGIHSVARQANTLGRFDAVIHNAGVYDLPKRVATADGLELTFAVNMLAPYVLTAAMTRPDRLIYLSSGLHRSGEASLSDPQWEKRSYNGMQAYCDSKLFIVAFAMALARNYPSVIATSVEPGWVATRMGGPNAPDDLAAGSLTQAWLAVSDDEAAKKSGGYFFHQHPKATHKAVFAQPFQDELIAYCERLAGVALP